jgi:flavin-dependent thymidylate synthase
MKVTLLNYTQDAADLLIFSKKTRLNMSADSFNKMKEMTQDEKQDELKYVFGTIGSSWEFVDYVFLIEGVTRAFTHQLVRHRVGVSFAQQAQRVVDMSEFEYVSTGECQDNPVYDDTMVEIADAYSSLIDDGVHPQDARGLLPTNIKTNILMKCNLRTLSGMLNIRLCVKAQGEFQNVAREMRRIVLEVHPWAERVLQVHCVQFGSCAFPAYKECPVKEAGFAAHDEDDTVTIKGIWETIRSEAQPKGG